MDTTKTRLLSKEQMIRDILEGANLFLGSRGLTELDEALAEIMKVVETRNPVMREAASQGIPVVEMMRQDLRAAWEKYNAQLKKDGGIETLDNVALMGRVRGLAQALATVQSPYTRLHESPRVWIQYVKRVMEEGKQR